MAEWRFRRRQEQCGICGRVFEEGERYVSALTITEEEIVREDACSRCWAGRAGVLDDELFYWFTRHRADRRRGLQLDLASLEALFEKLARREETAARELRFVLCLLLMRKRRLKLERVVRGADGEAMLVRKPRRKDTTRVYVFDFTPERLAELKGELQEVFESAALDDGPDRGANGGEDAEAEDGPEAELAASGASDA
jgi:hypothetical protein